MSLSSRFCTIHVEASPRRCPTRACFSHLTMRGESATILTHQLLLCSRSANRRSSGQRWHHLLISRELQIADCLRSVSGRTTPGATHTSQRTTSGYETSKSSNELVRKTSAALLTSPWESLALTQFAASQESHGTSCPRWGFPLSWWLGLGHIHCPQGRYGQVVQGS